MPEINVDESKFELYKQCEIRRPSPRVALNGYFYDIVWIKADLARKGARLVGAHGHVWYVHEVFGSKRMPGSREGFQGSPT